MKKGFTLIELLVVVAIIGILASVVLVALNGARVKTSSAKRMQTVQQIQKAVELYYSEYGYYPPENLTTIDAMGVYLSPYLDVNLDLSYNYASGGTQNLQLMFGGMDPICLYYRQGYWIGIDLDDAPNSYTLGDQGNHDNMYEVVGGRVTEGACPF